MSHALLSPSSAKRWMSCTPSARLEDLFPETTSEAAEEGTLAHHISECKLHKKLFGFEIEPKLDPKYHTQEMEDHTDSYVDFIYEKVSKAHAAGKKPQCGIEVKADMSDIIPDGFGTVDFAMATEDCLDIIDLKYGKGVKVDVAENPQLQLYAYGVLRSMPKGYEPKCIACTIYQPRMNNISTHTYTYDEIIEAAQKIAPAAILAYNGDGALKSGDHCRFCRARSICRTQYQHFVAITEMSDREVNTLSDEEIVMVLSKGKEVAKWIADVEEYAFKQALEAGRKWDGFKVVEGRSNRKITDPERAQGILMAEGFSSAEILESPKLKGLSALEKVVGKAKLAKMLEGVITKPEGSPTLVPESDKREAIITSVEEMFGSPEAI